MDNPVNVFFKSIKSLILDVLELIVGLISLGALDVSDTPRNEV